MLRVLDGIIVAQCRANFRSRRSLQVDRGLPNLCRSRELSLWFQVHTPDHVRLVLPSASDPSPCARDG